MVHEQTKRFPKAHRLRKRWQFLSVQNDGYKVTSRFFIGLVMQSALPSDDSNHARIGITTTGRYANAVVRNRTRRLVREAFRQGCMAIPSGIDLVIIPKKHAKFESSTSIFQDLATLGKRVRGYVEKTSC
ncbi:MAG: ribonuclease P protein component [Deltaproteobacteria bacterium]|nr:ribonuclease P protein component [Deltaproteobacteria bacterium]MBN2674059.1 ribonuclease P protein component [Deltaproteobacteria bacterium]